MDLLIRQVARALKLESFTTLADVESITRSLPPSPALVQRLEALEGEVLNNAGAVPRMELRVQTLEASRSATSIEVGGYVFVDEASTDAWARTLADPNLIRFCPDFVSMFLLADPKFETIPSGLEQMAAVVKAKFSSLDQATIGLSYAIIFPPRILKSLKSRRSSSPMGLCGPLHLHRLRSLKVTTTMGRLERSRKL